MKYTTFLFCLLFSISCVSQSIDSKNIQAKTKTYYKEINASHFIAPALLSFDNNAALKTKGLILEMAAKNQDPTTVVRKWNKSFYKNLPHHYSNSDALTIGAKILNIKNENSLQIINNWPSSLTEQEYDHLFKEIKIKLANKFEIRESMKGKYVITPNIEFWDITKETGYPLLVDILSTYEREFDEYELIHDDLDSALDYAVIIFDALCNQRDPDNSYYFNQIMLDQFALLDEKLTVEFTNLGLTKYDGLPIFNMNYYSKTKKEDYEHIINTRSKDLELTKRIFTNLPIPPFFITKIVNY